MMNRRRHATLSRMLIEACGGLVEAAEFCRVGKSQLGDYQNADGEGFMPADVISALEAHCGQPIYSRALFEAQPAATEAKRLTEEACEAAESVTDLQREIRLAAADGKITPAEKRRLAARAEAARRELGDVIDGLARDSAAG